MNKLFLFDEETESRDVYLTKAARWMDSIENGNEVGEGICLRELLDDGEIRELKNYVYAVMEPVIDDMATYLVHNWKGKDFAEDFEVQFAMEVWRNFYKFNNPKYKAQKYDYAFTTFARNYARDPFRTVRAQSLGLKKRLDDKRRMINRTKRYIIENTNIAPDDISVQDLFEFMPDVSNVPLSLKEIIRTLEETQPVFSIDACTNGDEELLGQVEEKLLSDSEVKKGLSEVFSKMRPIQIFIFLQGYNYTAGKFHNMTIKEFSACDEFLKLCQQDKIGSKHIKHGKLVIDRPRVDKEKKIDEMDLMEQDYVDDKYIRNERERVRKNLAKVVAEKEYTMEEVQDNLFVLMEELWVDVEKYIYEKK